MSKRTIAITVAILCICSGFTISPVDSSNLNISYDGNTLYVGGSGPGNYSKIQDAIDNASEEDTIFVYSGVYQEHIDVNKEINLIGEAREKTIIDGGGTGNVLIFTSSSVTMTGFTIQNSGQGAWDHGINVWDNHKDVRISDCILTGNSGGIQFNADSDSSIKNCRIHNNSANNIIVYLASSNITIENCIIDQNGEDGGYSGGICIDGITEQCSNIRITGCSIHHNHYDGISISKSKNIEIDHNRIYGSTYFGMVINGVPGPLSNITIHDNTVTENGDRQFFFSAGIYLQKCLNCVTVKNNNLESNNRDGILLRGSSGNTISGNNIMGNARFNAFFEGMTLPFRNYWEGNYWGRTHLLPKPILGAKVIWLTNHTWFPIPLINFDWHPAKSHISNDRIMNVR